MLSAGLAWWAINPRNVSDLAPPAKFWSTPDNSYHHHRGDHVKNGGFWYIVEED